MIELREAEPADITVLSYWDTKQHVIDAGEDEDWNWAYELARKPAWRKMYIAELDRRAIGFIQIIDPLEEETHYWGSVAKDQRAIDIWIGEESDLNKGYGTTMMKLALDHCFSDPNVIRVLIDPLASNTKAHRFYERLGFKFVEQKVFDGEACSVYAISRIDFEGIK